MDIHNIPFEDITYFLSENNQVVPKNKEQAYSNAWALIESGNATDAPPSVTDWIIARNLISTGIIIPKYKASKILTSSDQNLKALANILSLPLPIDKESMIRILGYLNKLDNDMSVFDTLPDDALESILRNLDCKSIFLMCNMSKRLTNFCTSEKLSPILSEKLDVGYDIDIQGTSVKFMKSLCKRQMSDMVRSKEIILALIGMTRRYPNLIIDISNFDIKTGPMGDYGTNVIDKANINGLIAIPNYPKLVVNAEKYEKFNTIING